jgi:hypothetical protein
LQTRKDGARAALGIFFTVFPFWRAYGAWKTNQTQDAGLKPRRYTSGREEGRMAG